jgi:ribosome-associated toxin RatA of RatAB toxin-antitoxin module
MRRVRRSAIVPYSASDMYRLVKDVESYPDFLPWCSDVEVHSRQNNVVEATLEFRRGALKKRFRTRNAMIADQSMELSLVGGPFRDLSGGWRFSQLGDTGSKVSLDIKFEFDSRALDLMVGPFFEDICNSLVDAFTQRAHAIYGERTA